MTDSAMVDESTPHAPFEPGITEEERAIVRYALQLLAQQAPNDASVVDMHYLMDVPVNEIADYLHVPDETVHRWLRRGRRRLRAIIAELRGDELD